VLGGSGGPAVESAVIATTLERANAIRAATAQEVATAAEAEVDRPNLANLRGDPSFEGASRVGRSDADFRTGGVIEQTGEATTGMQHVLASLATGRRSEALAPTSRMPLRSDLIAANPVLHSSLGTALHEADDRVLMDESSSEEQVHSAVLRRIQSAFQAGQREHDENDDLIPGTPSPASRDGGSSSSLHAGARDPLAAALASDTATTGDSDPGRMLGVRPGARPGAGGGLVGFLDERQGRALDELLDELGVPVPGTGTSHAGTAESVDLDVNSGSGSESSELRDVLAMLEQEARSSSARKRNGRGRGRGV